MWWFSDKGMELIKKLGDSCYTMDFIKEVKSERYDHLGEIYMDCQSQSSARSKGQFLTPSHVSDLMSIMVLGEEKKKR